MLTVVSWLWRDPNFRFQKSFKYTPEHVNRLQRMVSQNLEMPHRFICMTDWPQEAFSPAVHAKPMWPDLREHGGCYTRLKAFAPEMVSVLGSRFVSMDIDCVVTGPLDPLFDRDEDFVIWEDIAPRQPVCGSMWMMTAGSRAHVWESFDYEAASILRKQHGFIGTDQAWMAAMLHDDEYVTWGKRDGVYSAMDRHFRRLITRQKQIREDATTYSIKQALNAGYTTTLPSDAKIVFFHGNRDPSMSDLHDIHPWLKAHYGEPFETRFNNVIPFRV